MLCPQLDNFEERPYQAHGAAHLLMAFAKICPRTLAYDVKC